MQKFFKTVWATSGDKTSVPDAIDASGYVSYTEGYTADYSRVIGVDPLAKPQERAKMNSVLYDITGELQLLQKHGVPDYISPALNGGTAYAYDDNSICRFTDGKIYLNTVASNTAAPDVSGWVEFNLEQILSDISSKLPSATYTASDILTKIKTVDGTGSGLDADLLDGQSGSYYLNATTGVTLDTTQTIIGSKTFDDGTLIAQSAADAPTFSAEMTTNGTFTGGTTGWTLPAEFVYGTDNVIYTVNAVASQIEQSISVTSGNRYLISWYQTNSAVNNGRITPKLGTVAGTECSRGTTATTNTQILTANTTGTVTFALEGIAYAGGTGTITIDNVSVTEITEASSAAFTVKKSNGTTIGEMRTSIYVENTNNGVYAGYSNTTGRYNTNNGTNAGFSNTTGYSNTNNGANAGYSNTTGYYNTNNGYSAGYSNTTGYSNTNNGVSAGHSNTTGYDNTNNGYNAGYSNTTGYYNTNNGNNAGRSNTTGYYNTNNGNNAGRSNTTGYYNTNNGYNAGRYLQSGANAETNINTSCLGYDSRVSGDNQVQLGNSATTTYVYGTVQNRSDARDKANIRDTALGLDFINLIRPVDYKWNMREDYLEKVTELDEDGNEIEKLVPTENDGSKTRNRYHHGVIAQEVKEACDTLGIDFGGYQDHLIAGGTDVLSIGYDEFVAPLIRAVQELTARVKELEAKLG